MAEFKLLVISHDSGIGGAQVSLMAFLSGLDRNKFDPFVILPRKGLLSEYLERYKITSFYVPIKHWIPSRTSCSLLNFIKFCIYLPLNVRSIIKIIKQCKGDIVYTNTVTCIEGALAAYIMHRPHFWHVRESIAENEQIKPYLPTFLSIHILKFLSQRIIVNSNYLRSVYEKYIPTEKITVIYNGFDFGDSLDLKKDADISLRNSLKIEVQTKIIAIIGTLHPGKGQDLFIEAARRIKDKFKNVVFLIIGGGDFFDYTQRLYNKVKSEGLEKDVFFLGWKKNIYDYFLCIDILVSASRIEPFGRVVMEAMAFGIPVVSTRSGGPEEIILDNETGILVDNNSSQQLADAVLRILKTPDLSKAMGRKGALRIKENFSLKSYVDKLEKILYPGKN